MRISTSQMFKNSVDSVSQRMVGFNNLASHLSAGKTLLAASDNPGGAADAVMQQSALSQLALYSSTRSAARSVMEYTDTVLNSCAVFLNKNLSEKLVAAGNGTLSDQDREMLGKEIAGITQNLLDLANTRDKSGRYLFSGYKADTAAFDAQGHYQGSDRAVRQTVADGREMQTGFTGQSIFMSGSDTDLFSNLQAAAEALSSQPADPLRLQSALSAASKAVDAGIDGLGKVQAELGTQLQQLDMLDTQAEKDNIAITESLQRSLGADITTQTKLVSEVNMSKQVMESSMLLFQIMQKMTLFKL